MLEALAGAAGSIFSAFGTASREKAQRKAYRKNERRVRDFTKKFVDESTSIKEDKDNILANSEDVFDRLGGFIFGDTDTLSNLRGAQENFSEMAAGNFDNFSKETQAIVSSALAGTHGGPAGSFENLSAKNLFDFRSTGLRNALSVTNNLATLGSGLIDTEFGIIDSDFNQRLQLENSMVERVNAIELGKAGIKGSTQAGIGQSLRGVGSAFNSYNTTKALEDIALNQSIMLAPKAELVSDSSNALVSGNQFIEPITPDANLPSYENTLEGEGSFWDSISGQASSLGSILGGASDSSGASLWPLANLASFASPVPVSFGGAYGLYNAGKKAYDNIFGPTSLNGLGLTDEEMGVGVLPPLHRP